MTPNQHKYALKAKADINNALANITMLSDYIEVHKDNVIEQMICCLIEAEEVLTKMIYNKKNG